MGLVAQTSDLCFQLYLLDYSRTSIGLSVLNPSAGKAMGHRPIRARLGLRTSAIAESQASLERRPERAYAFFGAPVDTGNLGVSALAISVLAGVAERQPDARVTLFDFAPGAGTRSLEHPNGRLIYTRRGAYRTRRFYRLESLQTMHVAARFAPVLNPNVRVVASADAVLDISGGDSFTDLYGPRRFVLVTMPKRIALQLDRPLHLLPQTFGPFQTARSRVVAREIVLGAKTAWARDELSFEVLRDLLGPCFDPDRHRRGVDVAFLLPTADPPEELLGRLGLLEPGEAIVGVNISGLLGNHPEAASQRFKLRADYVKAMTELLRRFVEATGVRMLLVPHVSGAPHESDHIAIERVRALVNASPRRIVAVPQGLDAMETKAIIGRCSWFVGARMHSTIAALSQCVPTAAVAYSDKTAGVFATCHAEDQVVDARRLETGDLVDALWERWEQRNRVKQVLEASLPRLLDDTSDQMDRIMGGPGDR